MQINARSIIGKHGSKAKSVAFKLISNNLAHFVATDCHSPDHRSMELSKSYEVVVSNWGKDIAKALFFENPKKVINGQKFETLEPMPIVDDSPKSFWQKIRHLKSRIL